VKTKNSKKINNEIPGLQKLPIDRNGEILFRDVPATLEDQVREGEGCRI